MTLPGYSYTPKTIQDHIHLGVVPASGPPVGFGVYGEPPYLVRHVISRTPVFHTEGEFVRAWDNTPHAHTRRKADGSPFIPVDYEYNVRVDPEAFDLLFNLQKRLVYLVDHWHCPANESHTPFVTIMWFDGMRYESYLGQKLEHQILSLSFLDAHTHGD